MSSPSATVNTDALSQFNALLSSGAPFDWFDAPACHSTAPRQMSRRGTTSLRCGVWLEGLEWSDKSSPASRAVASFHRLLERHHSLLDLFRAKMADLDSGASTTFRDLRRTSEVDASDAFILLFNNLLKSATEHLLDHYDAETAS
ncbi:hypothetical protein MVLG_05658 [Microbotryum lychnidis-dioicae p1A1 Lamole]|uniref:Uncharacterized protein n=1 Tax=Microbotryum lychnidis-dioicae (strain p1A1 Lamole / MvSl-1064) TaxID=683840 RepID=U5HEW9_USTV1|nr:hypothetical protein MVLG_05658 [Microbotryum lychnidis-dioicae p1A1 Lamole]|eukprot:KDE03904.1 hypothetical protein MVLG_05658 [Microbotryum lychnidis-dioicae p1A1 Lamole]